MCFVFEKANKFFPSITFAVVVFLEMRPCPVAHADFKFSGSSDLSSWVARTRGVCHLLCSMFNVFIRISIRESISKSLQLCMCVSSYIWECVFMQADANGTCRFVDSPSFHSTPWYWKCLENMGLNWMHAYFLSRHFPSPKQYSWTTIHTALTLQ